MSSVASVEENLAKDQDESANDCKFRPIKVTCMWAQANGEESFHRQMDKDCSGLEFME